MMTAAIVGAAFASAALGAAGTGLDEFRPGAIRPAGHLEEFLVRQANGTTGHRERLGYPFSGCMWAGSIPEVHIAEEVPFGGDAVVPRDEVW